MTRAADPARPLPPAPLDGPLGRVLVALSRRVLGEVPDSLTVLGHHPRVLRSVLALETRVRRWRSLDPHLQALAQLGAAAAVGCAWCLDLGYWAAHHDGLDLERLRDVPRWRDSERFDATERDVLALAEAMSTTPTALPDGLVARLAERLGDRATVELLALVALENMRARLNLAAGLTSQGFAAACGIPDALPSEG